MSFLGRDTSRMKTRPALCGGAIVRIWFLGFNFASMIWPWKCHGPHCFQVGVRELGSNVESKLWRLVHLAWALFPVFVQTNFGTLRYFGEWCFSPLKPHEISVVRLEAPRKEGGAVARPLRWNLREVDRSVTSGRLAPCWELSTAKLANGCQNWIFELHTVDSCQ